ncbi:hypothetical protein G7Z17_g5699 [Cylindrodendrum hubeiense]|uniref:Uncharacterized protein n=1 Tax=Cylindrodendrum hubeiense TaxID=595255 RepID=A0A9P5HBJ6_9HYPO|nr:hypothetical protein G7Z17_g5699 [Cylindrodendrum hubeiense]
MLLFPVSRPRESEPTRELPPYSGPDLSRPQSDVLGVSAGAPLPRVLPLKPEGYAAHPPPYYPGRSTSLEVKPLRLVRASRKRKPSRKASPPPPSYYETCSHTLFQSVTTLSIEPAGPPPTYLETMSSQPMIPKVGPSVAPSGPGPRPNGPGGSPPRAENVLADLRRQLDDSASDMGSSVDSRGRRRRRNNKQLATAGGIKTGPVLPRLAETKPVRLQLGLNLDVELELKARLQGDVSLTLLVEKKMAARKSTELKPNWSGEVSAEELFFMRLGTIRLRQHWLQREVSASLTASFMLVIGAAGFLLGFVSSRLIDSWGYSGLVVIRG